ncbi:MAG TPA: DUF2178 domain-containing protein [Thermoanaerobaculia bacterium]|nr:DUF2178 domain-containing protein [Thermoanaerobaculia bacterium]
MNENTLEVFERFSRRSMVILLFVVAILGGTALALILSPAGAVGRSAARAAWLIPVAIVIAGVATQSSLKGRRWNPASPEVAAIMQDEWRRTNMDRASRFALIVVLAAQWPLGLLIGLLGGVPSVRTAMAMAAASMTLGLMTVIALFLFFGRESRS